MTITMNRTTQEMQARNTQRLGELKRRAVWQRQILDSLEAHETEAITTVKKQIARTDAQIAALECEA